MEVVFVIKDFLPLILKSTSETVYMTILSTFFSYLLGLPIGIMIVVTGEKGIMPQKHLNAVLGAIVNVGRSIPFIILLVALIPFTRLIVGTSIGSTASIVPLVIAATPFVARLIESSLNEMDKGVIEAAQSMGATPWQIITKVMIPEAVPSIILGVSITTITLVSYSAMAGTVGGGGLGDLAIRYGYYRYQTKMMIFTIIILVVIVQIIQMIGNFVCKKIDKRK